MPQNKSKQTPHRRLRVALIVETSLASGRDILQGIARYVREQRPWSIYHEPRDLEDAVPGWLSNWKGDGIIARIQNEQIARAVRDTGLPVVDTLGLIPDSGVPLVHVDDVAVATLAADHLIECGFTNFGYCGVEGANWSKQRGKSFDKQIAAAGHKCHHYQLPSRSAQRDWEIEQDSLVAWIRSLPKPVGIMACNDPRGQRVLEACGRAEVLVPDEVAVIGVDNDKTLCEVASPPLSSVQAGHIHIGYEAASLLEGLIRGKKAPDRPIFLPPSGICPRQSTDVTAVDDLEVVRAIHFIRDFATAGISVNDVVHQAFVSRSVLQRRFQKALSRSIHDEIARERIKQVKKLLIETDLPVASIAIKTGFKHTEYLGVFFKSKTNMTPGQYRKQHWQ